MMRPLTVAHHRTPLNFFSAIFMAVIIAISGAPAPGQGLSFMVKPMKIEVAARPGQTVEGVFELRNLTQDRMIIDLNLADLTQTSQGTVQVVESGTINTNSSFSCWELTMAVM